MSGSLTKQKCRLNHQQGGQSGNRQVADFLRGLPAAICGRKHGEGAERDKNHRQDRGGEFAGHRSTCGQAESNARQH